MNQFNLSNFINKFVNYGPQNFNKGGPPGSNINNDPANADMKFPLSQEGLGPNMMQKSLSQSAFLNAFNFSMMNNLKMNNLASFERGLYIKDLMNLPKEMEEVLVLIQNKAETTEDITKLLFKNIDLNTLAELMQTSGKEAMNKMIQVMANASKQGITDVSQIKDAIKLINASISVAGQDNPSQILKSFMLLYLPWLPLKEGVDFDLEIESSEKEGEDSETTITIMISTIHYGNIRATLILAKGNSMSIIINCIDGFPKEELLKRINEESKMHSIQSNVMFEQKEMKKDAQQSENASHQAKISMSNLTQVNPFLLLMANAVIRHTIDLDNQAG